MALPPAFTDSYLRQLELLRLRATRSFLGSREGGHLSLKRGHGTQFSDYRKYELGDNPRHIDWGIYGRTDRLYIKRYQEEQEISVLLFLDSSSSMRVEGGDQKKWDLAKDLTLSLAYLALMQQDSVLLASSKPWQSGLIAGASGFHRLAHELAALPEDSSSSLLPGLREAAARFRFPGIAYLLSDFLSPLEDLMRGIDMLRAKNLDIAVLHILGAEDQDPFLGASPGILVDSETGEEIPLPLSEESSKQYRALLDEHCRKLREFFQQGAISYTLIESHESLQSVMLEKLSGTALIR